MPKPLYYEYADLSQRSGADLSASYGYPDIESLAADLPLNAEVLDVGAGFSTLGQEVATLREDVNWLKVDICYLRTSEPGPLPGNFYTPNLRSMHADVLELPQTVGSRQFDRVFSFWMLPYLTLTDPELGLRAAANILEAAKPAQPVTIGPTTGIKGVLRALRHEGCALTVPSPETPEAIRSQAESIVEATTLSSPVSWLYKANLRLRARYEAQEAAGVPQNRWRDMLTAAGVMLK